MDKPSFISPGGGGVGEVTALIPVRCQERRWLGMRTGLRIVFLIAGLVLVIAAVLLLLFADLPPAVAAAMGVPGLSLIATSTLIATSGRGQG
jgi:uncharacterized membrane protein YraQ (UPF0718 family)